MTDEFETGAILGDGAEDGAVARDRMVRGLILEAAGVELLLRAGRRRSSPRRRALLQYTVLLASRTQL